MSYVLGHLYADGCLKKQSYVSKRYGERYRYYVRFASIDRDVIEFIHIQLKCKQKIQCQDK